MIQQVRATQCINMTAVGMTGVESSFNKNGTRVIDRILDSRFREKVGNISIVLPQKEPSLCNSNKICPTAYKSTVSRWIARASTFNLPEPFAGHESRTSDRCEQEMARDSVRCLPLRPRCKGKVAPACTQLVCSLVHDLFLPMPLQFCSLSLLLMSEWTFQILLEH